jgi:hypothetical protein
LGQEWKNRRPGTAGWEILCSESFLVETLVLSLVLVEIFDAVKEGI